MLIFSKKIAVSLLFGFLIMFLYFLLFIVPLKLYLYATTEQLFWFCVTPLLMISFMFYFYALRVSKVEKRNTPNQDIYKFKKQKKREEKRKIRSIQRDLNNIAS